MSRTEIACDGDACIIAGSEQTMRQYLTQSEPDSVLKFTIKKARFGEIMKAMSLGAAYAFDEESYGRFYPLAAALGHDLEQVDFSLEDPEEIKFMKVQLGFLT